MNKKLYQEVTDKWGVDAQLDVAIEELSELIKEICKRKRGYPNINNLAEEIADVEIMVEQLRFIYESEYCISDRVDIWKDYKLKRLAEKVKE
jgi:NTP pyrophosphatase (non-canonical NTP hydrolase)